MIEGISPALTRLAEIVGGNTGDDGGKPRIVEIEEMLVGPDIRAVVGDEDGEIADDTDATVVGVFFQGIPLTAELILNEGLEANFSIEFLGGIEEGGRIATCERSRPEVPGGTIERFLEGHEEGVVPEPPSVGVVKGGDFFVVRWRGGFFEEREEVPEMFLTNEGDLFEVDPGSGVLRRWD